MDTPELKDSRNLVECFALEAKKEMERLVGGKEVKLESDTTQGEVDKYGRLLRYVYLEDGTMVNMAIISGGFGFEYTYRLPYKYREEFVGVQKNARDRKVGLWGEGKCRDDE